MRKGGVWLAALVFLGACATGGRGDGGQYTRERDFQWERNDNGVTITGFRGRSTDVRIPPYIQGMPVTEIDSGAAWHSLGDGVFEARNLVSVSIPENVTRIGNRTFLNNALAQIKIPDGVTSIGGVAFASNQLTSVTIPDRVTYIGRLAFQNNRLTSVIIPDDVTIIQTGAFRNNQLTSVTIGNGIRDIGERAFANNHLADIPCTHEASVPANAFAGNPPLQAREQAERQAEQERVRQAEQARLAELYRQAGDSLGNLANTSWIYRFSGNVMFFGFSTIEDRIDFGHGSFLRRNNTTISGTPLIDIFTGTFRVNGSTVIFLSPEGVHSTGTIIGNSLTIGNTVFNRF